MWTAHRVSVLVSPPRCVGALRCAARLSRPGTRVPARPWVVRAATSPGHPWCGSGVAGRWCRRPGPPRSTTGTAATRARTAATSRTRRHAAWVGRGSRSRRTALDDPQVPAVTGRQSAGGALAVRRWCVHVRRAGVGGAAFRRAPRPGTPCKGVRVGSGRGLRTSAEVRPMFARTIRGLTCGFTLRTQPAHAFTGGGSLLVDRRAGWLVLVPVVKLVATLGALPQTTSDQLAHGRVRVVAEPRGHAGRHEPVGEVACGPAAGPGPQR